MKYAYQAIKTVFIFLLTISVPALFLLAGGFRDSDLGFFALPWYVNFGAIMLYSLPVIIPITELSLALDRYITKTPYSYKLKKLNYIAVVSAVIELTAYIIVLTLFPDDKIVIGVFTATASILLITWITLLILRRTSENQKALPLLKFLNTATPITLGLTAILYVQNIFRFRSAGLTVWIYFILTILTVWIIKLCKFRNEIRTPEIYRNKSFWICAAVALFLLLVLTSR